jgi:hypothetical protein
MWCESNGFEPHKFITLHLPVTQADVIVPVGADNKTLF